MMQINYITLFPEFIEQGLSVGVVSQAFKKSLVKTQFVNPRSFTTNVHHTVDDRPFGGGDGMLMMYEPLAQAIKSLQAPGFVIYLSPQGQTFNHQLSLELAQKTNITLISGRYAGVDQRFINEFVHLELSLGDFVLSGGELAALCVTDAILRQKEGVLGHEDSARKDSFAQGWLECPQFTRPQVLNGQSVPPVLTSGNHLKIVEWKEKVACLVTLKKRPDIYMKNIGSQENSLRLLKFYQSLSQAEKQSLAIENLKEGDFDV